MASATKLTKMESQPGPDSPVSRLLTPTEAAEVLGVPLGTLAQWRSQRRGPAFIKLEGRLVRYRSTDLKKYISGRIVETDLTVPHA